MIMRTFPGLLIAALTLSACAIGSYDPQTVTDSAARGSALAQIAAECQEQALAPEFDMIRSRVNMSMTGANPAPFMLTNMEVPNASERIQIARWSAIRDSCSQRVVALISEPRAAMSQGLWQKVVEITEHNSHRQHALMMALARGEMPYGQFAQEDTLIGVRTAAAIRPFTQEGGVIDQAAIAAPAADQSAPASGAFFGNLVGAPLESLGGDAGALRGSALAQDHGRVPRASPRTRIRYDPVKGQHVDDWRQSSAVHVDEHGSSFRRRACSNCPLERDSRFLL
jgi:hypothetical protein